MKAHYLPLLASLGCSFATPALARQYFSAQFCQPAAVAHSEPVTTNCPISAQWLGGMQHVQLYYAAPSRTDAVAVSCQLLKFGATGSTEAGQATTSRDQSGGVLDLYSSRGPANPVGMSVQCQLAPGAKILGYYLD